MRILAQITVAFAMLVAIYLSVYAANLTEGADVTVNLKSGLVIQPRYRVGGSVVRHFFRPAFEIDKHFRPSRWDFSELDVWVN